MKWGTSLSLLLECGARLGLVSVFVEPFVPVSGMSGLFLCFGRVHVLFTVPSTRCSHRSGRPGGGAFQHNLLSHSGRDTTGGNALTSYVTLTLLLISRSTVHSFSSSSCDIHIFAILPLAAAVYIFVEMNPAPAQVPQQTARPLADLLTTVARFLTRRQPHNAPSFHTAWTIQQIVNEEYRILEVLDYELATHTSAWIEVFERRLCLWRQRLQQSRRPACSLTVRKLLMKCTFGTSPSPQDPATLGHQRGSSPARSGFVFNWQSA